MEKKVLKATTKLWKKAVDEELLDDVVAEVALGAHYAKLALDGTVELTDSGAEKVETAHEALTDLLGEDD